MSVTSVTSVSRPPDCKAIEPAARRSQIDWSVATALVLVATVAPFEIVSEDGEAPPFPTCIWPVIVHCDLEPSTATAPTPPRTPTSPLAEVTAPPDFTERLPVPSPPTVRTFPIVHFDPDPSTVAVPLAPAS